MSGKAQSFEFCGRKIVPWGYRARRAVKVYRGFHLVALCPSGAVAVDADRLFKSDGALSPSARHRLAADLFEVGAISARCCDEQQKIAHAGEIAKRRKEAADEIAEHAETLGVKFTKAQAQRIAKAT